VFETAGVGERNRDRQLAEARVAYVAAVRRFDQALRRFDESDIPLDPGTGRDPYPWTAEHVKILRALHTAIAETIDARRSWDMMRREWTPSHG
jgi:hypothetical protein